MKKRSKRRGGTAIRTSAIMVAALSCPTLAADWKFDAGVDGRETYTDNVTLTSTNRQSDFVTEINPHVAASKRGSRFEADFQYSMQNLFYADQSTRNRINHRLAAHTKAELYEEHLYLDASATISQQNTSALGAPANTNNATGNVSDIYTVSISPYWRQRFGSTANLMLRYNHNEFTSSTSGLNSSVINGVNATLGSGSGFKDIFWSLDYNDQHTNYSGRPDVRINATSGTLGYIFSPKFRVNGTLGYDKNEYQAVGSTPPQGSFWNAGFSWTPSSRTSLTAGLGERYTGKTYILAFDHRARKSTWRAAYNQAVMTTSSQFASGETENTFDVLFNDPGFIARHPNPLERALWINYYIISGILPAEFSRSLLSNQVFLNKRFDASVVYQTAKTTTSLALFDNTRESLESGTVTSLFSEIFDYSKTVKQRGINASWLWKMNARMSASVMLSRTRSGYSEGRTDNLTMLNFGINRTFDKQVTGSVYLRRQQRDGNADIGDFTENALIGAVNYKF